MSRDTFIDVLHMDICKNYSYFYSSLQIELVSLKILMDRAIDYIHYRTVIVWKNTTKKGS